MYVSDIHMYECACIYMICAYECKYDVYIHGCVCMCVHRAVNSGSQEVGNPSPLTFGTGWEHFFNVTNTGVFCANGM